MSRYLTGAILALCLSAVGPAAAAPANCAGDKSLQACVVSAALTFKSWNNRQTGEMHVFVSVTLELTNTTEYPLDIAFVADDSKWSFTPVNSESIVPTAISDGRALAFAGGSACVYRFTGDYECTYAPLSPGASQRVQVSYSGALSQNGLPLVQIASKASLSGVLSLRERGQQRLFSLPVPEFAFGNGLANFR